MLSLLDLSLAIASAVESVLFLIESKLTEALRHHTYLLRAALYGYLAVIHGLCLVAGHG